MKKTPVLTMRFWYECKAQGVDLFNLTESGFIEAWELSRVSRLEDFARAVRFFYCGNPEETQAQTSKDIEGNSPRRRLDDADIYAACALVPGWLELPWFIVVNCAIEKRKYIARERSLVLSLVNNVHASRRSDVRTPDQFNEYERAKVENNRDELRRKYGYKPRTLSDLIEDIKQS